MTAYVEQQGQCSQCENKVDQDSQRLKQCHDQLRVLFPEYERTCVPSQKTDVESSEGGHVSVAMMNGDSTSVQLKSAMTVAELRVIVESDLRVPPENQQLIYNGQEMKVNDLIVLMYLHYK